ncbi:MAG: HDOD domain-containing protein [Bermanella sp.]
MAETESAAPSVPLPEIPPVLLEIKDAKNDLNAIAQIITQHPELYKEVLATINAPYFSLVREIKSAEEAVRMLGMHRIVNLTTGRLLRTTIFAGKDKLLSVLWKTSLKVAVISVLISKELDIAATDESYTTAIFHNAGMAILNQTCKGYPKVIKAAYFDETGQISEHERQHLGTSHAAMGAQLSASWGLSGAIGKCIHVHHDPDKIITQIEKKDEAGELLLVLKIAEQIARLPGYLAQCVNNHEWEIIKDPIFDELKMTEGMYRRFEVGIKKKMSEIKS